jgi:hypothetical protein
VQNKDTVFSFSALRAIIEEQLRTAPAYIFDIVEAAVREAEAQIDDPERQARYNAVDTVHLLHDLGENPAVEEIGQVLDVPEEDAASLLSAWTTIREIEQRAQARAAAELEDERKAEGRA